MTSSGSAGESRPPAKLTFLLLSPTHSPSPSNETGLIPRSSAKISTASPVLRGSGKLVVMTTCLAGPAGGAAGAAAGASGAEACALRRHSSIVARSSRMSSSSISRELWRRVRPATRATSSASRTRARHHSSSSSRVSKNGSVGTARPSW